MQKETPRLRVSFFVGENPTSIFADMQRAESCWGNRRRFRRQLETVGFNRFLRLSEKQLLSIVLPIGFYQQYSNTILTGSS